MTGPTTLAHLWVLIASFTALLVAAIAAYAWARSRELKAMGAAEARAADPRPTVDDVGTRA